MEERTHNKTEEEIRHDMQVQQETTRQRKFVKEVLYPWLMDNSKSIDDAKNILYAAAVGIQQTFHVAVSKEQTRLSTVPLKELEVDKNVLEGAEFDRDRALLALFAEEPVATAESLITGCKKAIESFQLEASTKTALKDLPAELLD